MPVNDRWRRRASAWWAYTLASSGEALGLRRVARVGTCLRLWHNRADRTAWAVLAMQRARQGRLAAAVRWQRRHLQLAPHDPVGWYNLGFLLDQCHQPRAAVEAFERAVALNECHDLAWFGLGRGLRQLGRWDEALRALDRNIALQPWSPHAHVEKAHVHAACHQWESVHDIVRHLDGFEPRWADRLETDYGLTRSGHGARS